MFLQLIQSNLLKKVFHYSKYSAVYFRAVCTAVNIQILELVVRIIIYLPFAWLC